MESTECSERLCGFAEECEYDLDCISGLCSERDKICTYPHMCTRDQIYNCNFDQCQELNRRFREYFYDDKKQRCINKSIDITYTDFEINQETIDLVSGAKKEETKQLKQAVINSLNDSKCAGIPDSIDVGVYINKLNFECDPVINPVIDPLVCQSSYERVASTGMLIDDVQKYVIPCIWEYQTVTSDGEPITQDDPAGLGSCKKINDADVKYGGFSWDDIREYAPPDEQGKDSDNFFKCPISIASPSTER